MLKKILKILFIALGSIVLVLAAFYAFVHFSVDHRINQVYADIPAESFTIPNDSSSLALGAHLAVTKGCTDCHGPDLAGRVMIDDPALGRIVTANLTRGKGGIGGKLTDEDWIRALRHGISHDFKPLLVMPSEEYTHLTQEDLGALIAYCKSMPAVDRELPDHDLRPVGRLLTHFDKLPLLSVEVIDHHLKAKPSIEKVVSAEYGAYLAVTCKGCHKPDFKGGDPIIPGSPQVADITATGNLSKWTEDQFMQVLRTGKTPEGKALDNEFMPWKMTASYSDDELKSLYLYLKSCP